MRKIFLIILIAFTLMTSCTSLVKSFANNNSTIEVKSDGQFAFYRKGDIFTFKFLEFISSWLDSGHPRP